MPIVTASKVTMRTPAATTLLTSFMAWPVPTLPQWKIFGLMVSKIGLICAYASAGAPTMMAMVRASAPCGPALPIRMMDQKNYALDIGTDLGLSSAQTSVKTCQGGQVDPSVTVPATIAATNSMTSYVSAP